MELADSQPFTRGVFTLNRGQKIGGHRGNSCSVVTFYHDFCHDQGLDAMGSTTSIWTRIHCKYLAFQFFLDCIGRLRI
jgi:hypothetical protein